MLLRRPRLTKPGLFITATDTGVGKTVATCAIATALRRHGVDRIAVFKPFATGCRRDREGLVSEDAEALAHFADCRAMLDIINPVRYARPLAPGVAAEVSETPPDLEELVRCLEMLDRDHDAVLIEGVGGLLVPLLGSDAQVTVLDLMREIGLPVAVVCRAGLGTLNHTAMTVRLLREAGCDLAGLIVNGYIPDPADPMATQVREMEGTQAVATRKKAVAPPASSLRIAPEDDSMVTNRRWLQRMNHTSILATLPLCPAESVAPQRGQIPAAIIEAAALTFWPDVLELQRAD